MQRRIDVDEADLPSLLDELEAGADIILTRNGVPVARLERIQSAGMSSVRGAWRGRVQTADDFDAVPRGFVDGDEVPTSKPESGGEHAPASSARLSDGSST
jgi:antitoxin (DNA-binding transcriptional repressor) of toxin-antitoxin stability system